MDIMLHRVSKQYDGTMVLNELTLTFQEGRVNCLMGPSGVGKTTLLHILMGIVKQDSGEILGLHGKRISAVFQEDRLIEHWDAVKNVKLVCEKEISEGRIREEFSKVALEMYENKPVLDLSGGMRRRVAIVRAMLSKSDLVIMDEPFKGLDEVLKGKVIEYVTSNMKGRTVIIVTHDKEDIPMLGANLITLEY